MSRLPALLRRLVAWWQRRPCVMCDARTPYALDPRHRGLGGPVLGLCGPCFNDDDRLAHAVAHARARWR